MKQIFLTLALFLATITCFSQNYDFQYILNKLNSQTDLSDEQRVQLLGISSNYYPQAMEIYKSNAKDEVKLAQAYALKTKLDIDLKKILTKEQFTEYDKMCKEYEMKYLTRKK